MSQVNRSAFRIRPREPYIEWANAHSDDGEPVTLEDFEDGTVYMVPVFETDEEAEDILGEVYDIVFALELSAWTEEEAHWPTDRDLELFLEWFEIEPGSLVVDLTDEPLEVESD